MSKYYKADDIISFLNTHCPKDMWEYQIADTPTIDIAHFTPKPIMTEEVREALMRLSMCAREECTICKYENSCGFDKQVEMATENMHIILNAFDTTPTERTGEWIYTTNPIGEKICVCSECRHIKQQGYKEYCGHCGAKMDRERREE